MTTRRHDTRRSEAGVDGDPTLRARLARYLGRSAFPGDRRALVRFAQRLGAPDDVLTDLQALPAGEFTDVDHVVHTLAAARRRGGA